MLAGAFLAGCGTDDTDSLQETLDAAAEARTRPRPLWTTPRRRSRMPVTRPTSNRPATSWRRSATSSSASSRMPRASPDELERALEDVEDALERLEDALGG